MKYTYTINLTGNQKFASLETQDSKAAEALYNVLGEHYKAFGFSCVQVSAYEVEPDGNKVFRGSRKVEEFEKPEGWMI